MQSVEALIAAAEVVQAEVGPPVPGTYRHDFLNDTEPRQVPMSARGNMEHFAAMFGPTQTEDIAAMEVVTQLMPGALHDMSRLPAPVWQGFAPTVASVPPPSLPGVGGTSGSGSWASATGSGASPSWKVVY